MWQSPDRKLIFHFMLGLVGVLAILYSTTLGVGISSDSVGYIGGAESLLHGQGYSHFTGPGELKPTTQWPPLFSLALTPFGFVGLSIPEGARWLNALLFGINILLAGYVVYRNTAFWPAIFASLIILTSVDQIRLHAMAYSEPLYFFLGLSGLYFLDKYINTSKTYPLIISALLMSAATLTRYIGVTLIVTLCLSILILGKRSLGHRLVDCAIAGAISSLPVLLLVMRNVSESGRAIVYLGSPQARLITAAQIRQGLNTISLWLLPDSISFSLRQPMLGAVALIVVLMLVRFRRSIASSFWWLNVIYVFIYCLGLSLSIISVDPRIPYDYRYLSPVFVSVVIILTLSIYRISRRAGRWVGVGVLVFCVLFSISYIQRTVSVVKGIRQNGQGWEMWRESKIISLVMNLPGDVRIYSTNPIPMRFLSHRDMRELPWKFDQYTLKPSPDYFRTIEEIGATSQSQRIIILYVNAQPPAFMSVAELKQDLALKEIEKEPEASLFEVFHQTSVLK